MPIPQDVSETEAQLVQINLNEDNGEDETATIEGDESITRNLLVGG